MAKEKEEIKGLVAIAKKMAELREGTNMPSGKKDDVAENQVTELDMIAGICSAALFGSANRNKDNYKNLLSNPNKSSYLGQIYTLLNVLSKQFKPIISDKALQVKSTLIGMSPEMIKYFMPIENSSENALGQIIIDINGINNVDDLNKVLVELAENTNNVGLLLDGLTGIFDVISKINELTSIDTSAIATNVKNINDLATELKNIGGINNVGLLLDGLTDIFDAISKINELTSIDTSAIVTNVKNINDLVTELENIGRINNVDDLNRVLVELAENTNNVGLLDGLTGIFDVISKINELTSVDTSTVITNIENINELATKLDQINEIKLVDTDKLNQIVVTTDDINKIITHINQLPQEIQTDILSDNKISNTIIEVNKIIDAFNGINKFPDDKKIKEFEKFIGDGKISGKLPRILTEINKLTKSLDVKTNVKGVGELIQGIISIANFNGKIDTVTLNTLADVVKKNGPIAKIIVSINRLGLKEINKESIEALEHVQTYFKTVSSIAEISTLDKLRIMLNVAFFKYYVNNSLPKLIADIDKNFKNVSLKNKDNVLHNLQQYFDALKNIASLSVKDQINLFTSISVLRGLVIDNLGELIKEISEKFKDVKINKNVTKVFDLFDKIKNLTINTTFDEQRKALYGLHKFLFGTSPTGKGGKLGSIGRGLDFIKGQSSVLSIINRLNEESDNFATITKPLNQLKKVFESINNVITNNSIDPKEVYKLQVALDKFNIGVFGNLIKISEDNEDGEYKKGLDIIKDFSKSINTSFKKIDLNSSIQKIVIGKDTYKQFEETVKLFEKLPKLFKAIELASKIKLDKTAFKALEKVADKLAIIVNKFASIDPKNVKAAIDMLNEITKFMLIGTGILILGTLAMSFFKFEDMFTFVAGLTVICGLFVGLFKVMSSKDFDPNNLNEKILLAFKLGSLIAVFGVILALGGKLMQNIEWPSIWKFLGGVAIMLVGTIGIMALMKVIEKYLIKSLESATQLALLVVACGISVALAAAIGSMADPLKILAFGGAIMMLLLGIMVPLIFFKGVKTFMFQGINDLGILVLSCALALALAGLVTKYLDMKSLFQFTLMLTILVGGIMLATGVFGKSEIQGAKDLGTMVLYCSAALLLGGMLFTLWPELKNGVKEFAITLVLFTGAILLVAGLAALMGGEALQHIANLNKIVTWSAATLLIGGLLFMLLGKPFEDAVKKFALTLFLFVFGIGLTVALVGIFVSKEALGKMWMLALLVGVSALSITLGPILLKEYNVGYDDVLYFVLLSLGFVGGMGLIVWGLSKIDTMDLIKGILAAAAIEALIYGLGLCIGKLCETIKIMNTINNLWKQIGNIGLIFGAVGLVVIGLGMLLFGPQALVFAAGVAALATLEGVIWGMSKCILAVTKAVKALNEIKGVNIKKALKPLFDFIDESKGIFTSFGLFEILKIKKVIGALSGMGNMISSIAEGVKRYAELKIPTEWDPKTGRPIGFRHLTDRDFRDAAKNIGVIISTLGGAVLAIYTGKEYDPITGKTGKQIISEEDAKDMFSSSWFSGSKFSSVVKSLSKLGGMISSIAWGIQNYANLKIPTKWNSDGKPIDFTKMTDQDFTNAGQSIAKVISTLGLAIMAVYNGKMYDPATGKMIGIPGFTKEDAHDMFCGGGWFGKSPFRKVIDSTSKLGEVISSLSEGIQNYAYLKIPTEWDPETGKPLKYKKMTDDEFTSAGEAIGKVILSLGKAVTEVANTSEFDSYYDLAKMKAIVDSICVVSDFMSKLNDSIIQYATGKFFRLEYKDGQLNTTTEGMLDVEAFGGWGKVQKALTTSVTNVLLGFGMALSNAMNPKDESQKEAIKILTKDNNKVAKFIQNIALLSDAIKPLFDNINEIIAKPIIGKQVDVFIRQPFNMFTRLFDGIGGDGDKNFMAEHDERTQHFIDGISSMSDVIAQMFENLNKSIAFKITEDQINTSILKPFDKFIEVFNGIDTKNTIKYFLKEHDEQTAHFIDGISDMSDTIIGLFKNLFKIKTISVTNNDVTKFVINPFNKFVELFKGIDDENDVKYIIRENSKNIIKFIDIIKDLTKDLNIIFTSIDKFQKLNIGIEAIQNLKDSFSKYIEIPALLINFNFDDDKYDELSNFNASIEQWISVIDKVDLENTENKTNVLANSITTLFSTIANLQQNSGFADHVDTVKRYVEAINDVDIDKIESMTNLAFAVTNLGDKIGNIDKFTDTLAKKIALTLNALTKQIKDASVIIKDADTLHKKRETSIKNSIGKITDLMNKSMVVEIKNDQPTTTLTGGTGGFEGGGGTDTTGTTPGGGSDTTVVQTPPNSNNSSSGRSGGSSVEIDYDKLAKAIARAFKQM